MAKRKVNKSAAIRVAFETLGTDAKPAEVVKALAAKKIKVSPQAVSQVKANAGNRKGKRKAKVAAGGGFDLESLLQAKRLVDKIGLESARAALDALVRLS
jgi:hypothetical protein